MTTVPLNVGPTEVIIDEVVAGSELRFSFKLESEDPNNVGTFSPFDFTGYTLVGHVKRSVIETLPLETMSVTAPGVDGAGWVDCVLDGSQTTDLAELGGRCTFVFSIKMTPNNDADAGVTILVGSFPVVRRATA